MLILGIINPTSFGGDCGQAVSSLNKGQPAPCAGFLFSPDKELEVRTKVQQYDNMQQESDIKDKQIQLYQSNAQIYEEVAKKQQQEVELYRKKAEDSTEKYIAAENSVGLRDALFFGLGVTSILFGAWVVKQVK